MNQSSEQGLYTTSSYVKAVAACQLNVLGQKDMRMQMSVDSQSIVIQPISQPLGTHLAFLLGSSSLLAHLTLLCLNAY